MEALIESIYQKEYARLLAVLTRLFGPNNFDLVEDTLHDAFGRALTHWQENGVPEKPAAWLMQAAKNRTIDVIRAHKNKERLSQELGLMLESEWSLAHAVEQEFTDESIQDDQLRMIFMCCRDDIAPDNRLPFILKNICGLRIAAIARALLIPEATVKKRLLRTKEKLRQHVFELPPSQQLLKAMDSVHTAVYLVFNEGFHSSDKKQVMDTVLCQEAIGLAKLLVDESKVANRDTFALLALMHCHMSRLHARLDEEGGAIPIDRQDRRLWDMSHIHTAIALLDQAVQVQPGASNRFFHEACIALTHSRATRFADTNWPVILQHYRELERITQSPVVSLNAAIAEAYAGDVKIAIDKVNALLEHKALIRSHMPSAILAHLHAMNGDKVHAYRYADASKAMGGTPSEQHIMMTQIEALLGEDLGLKRSP